MNIVNLVAGFFGFLFGADGIWERMLFPAREELAEAPPDRICQFPYILRPFCAAIVFTFVWLLITKGPNALVDTLTALGLAQTIWGAAAGLFQWGCNQIHLFIQAVNDWIYRTFAPVHFLFPYNLAFDLTAIGIYIACYRTSKKLFSKRLRKFGKDCLDAHPAWQRGLSRIYIINAATGKVMLSPKWERLRRVLGRIITANFFLVYALNAVTNFATSPMHDFLQIDLLTFVGFFCLMEVYHFLGLGDVPQYKYRKTTQLNLVKLFTDYKLYAKKKGIPIVTNYRNSRVGVDDENQQYVSSYEEAQDPKTVFLYQYLKERGQTDCMDMAVQLLEGNSAFYASPFYKDIDGCIFFLMFLSLLQQEKGLILTEDSEMLDELAQWLSDGLDNLSGLKKLWNIAVLQDAGENADVGILPFQACPGLLVNEVGDFLEQVSFVVVLEASNMLIGGQELVLSLAERIAARTTGCTWLLCDWNAESMLDLFSHLLKIDLTYVSATPAGAKEAVVSYWDTETEPAYIWPPAKRFLGLETGIATVAEKNEVPCVNWYGADRMPVTDISWITAQYDQVHSGQIGPVRQDHMPTQVRYSVSGISHGAEPESFLIVEDSCCNCYETARQYVTRGREKAYVHVLSPNYLLRDFMRSHRAEMENDPKYLAQLVPEYMNSLRNTYLHLLRRLLVEEVPGQDIYMQLSRCEEPPSFVKHPISEFYVKGAIKEMIKTLLGISIDVNSDIQVKTHEAFSEEEARMVSQPWYHITGKEIHRAFLKHFRQARYIDETGRKKSISHLMLAGHLQLKYLPGQFVTMNGKYYQIEQLLDSGSEMLLSLTRASDQLRERWFYRQLRTYEVDGASEKIERMPPVSAEPSPTLSRLSLNFTARTTGYIAMKKGWNVCSNDKEYTYEGPARHYFRKQVLRVDLPAEEVGEEDFLPFAAIIHDMFYTFFPQYCYLLSVAVIWEESGRESLWEKYRAMLSRLTLKRKKPLEHAEGQAESGAPDKKVRSFYIFEDSYEDMGLLRSIERHFPRILQTAAEYVEWVQEEKRCGKEGAGEAEESEET